MVFHQNGERCVTSLQVRRMRFDFDGDVPFLWNPENPAFSLQMNVVSVLAIAFEKFIVTAVREALPLITDAEAAEEAGAFLRQEAQHASCHRQHLRALAKKHPGVHQVVDDAIASFDGLTETKSLAFRLAYIADLEATFTPVFKLYLDNERSLFRGGDDRVASLLLWHFVEEVEHRSSGLVVYGAVVPSAWYRTLVLPAVVRHMAQVLRIISEGFNAHVPLEDREVDARELLPSVRIGHALQRLWPWSTRRPIEMAAPYADLPRSECVTTVRRILLSQTPYHDPAHQPLPGLADEWFARFERGEDMAHWYATERVG
jgi:predicted metal-dependent hydrolase